MLCCFYLVLALSAFTNHVSGEVSSRNDDEEPFGTYILPGAPGSVQSHLFARCIDEANTIQGKLAGFPLASGRSYVKFIPTGDRVIEWTPKPADGPMECAEAAEAEISLMFMFTSTEGCLHSGRQIYSPSELGLQRSIDIEKRQASPSGPVYISDIHTCQYEGIGFVEGETSEKGGECGLTFTCTIDGWRGEDPNNDIPAEQLTCCTVNAPHLPCTFYTALINHELQPSQPEVTDVTEASLCDAEKLCQTMGLQLTDMSQIVTSAEGSGAWLPGLLFMSMSIYAKDEPVGYLVRVNIRSDDSLTWRHYPGGVAVNMTQMISGPPSAPNLCAAYVKREDSFYTDKNLLDAYYTETDCSEEHHYFCSSPVANPYPAC